MEQEIQILPITAGSDGDGRKWPKHHYERNDEYFKERIASDKWIHDLPGGPQPNVTYRLDRLPNGYAGFQRPREDSKHIDRYIYGHPNGQFRSLNEFYPHFKHLMDFGGPVGCTCKLCVNGSSRAKTKPVAAKPTSAKPSGSGYASDTSGGRGQHSEPMKLISPFKPGLRTEERQRPQKRKLIDVEGVPDIYETLIQQLKDASPDESVDQPIVERMSPDWRVGNIRSKEQVEELRLLPRYVPRPGELVLFDDGLKEGQRMAWDKNGQTFRRQHIVSGTLLEQPLWKAGVVTQIPRDQISHEDLVSDEHKDLAVNESGFRIEPLSMPGADRKQFSKQLKYVPLHAIRPLYLWRECLKGVAEKDAHTTVRCALMVASSFCVVGRFRFRGVWPKATVFVRGAYLGPELILVGDTVRLIPRKQEQRMDNVTEVMVVTAIRLRFVNLNAEDDDMAPELPGLPYQTCLHFSGRVYTLDPTRSFDGVGKVPIDPDSDVLPPGIAAYGQWYHYSDPEQASARTELPFTRILGRCFEDTVGAAWFKTGSIKALSSSKAINSKVVIIKEGDNPELTRGLQNILDARFYSHESDKRIKPEEGKSWFWADTRVQQLDLHEVNQRDVGIKNKERTKGQMASWKASLKKIDGKKGAAEEYKAAKSKLKEQTKLQTSYGMMRAPASSTEPDGERISRSASGSAQASGQDVEDDDVDAMDIDEAGTSKSPRRKPLPLSRKPASASRSQSGSGSGNGSGNGSGSGDAGFTTLPTVPPKRMEAITLSDSEDGDHLAADQSVGKLSKNIRPNDSRRGGSSSQAIELD